MKKNLIILRALITTTLITAMLITTMFFGVNNKNSHNKFIVEEKDPIISQCNIKV